MELIDAQPGHNGGQKCFIRIDALSWRGLSVQVGFLHDVLGIHCTSQHAVGDGKELRTIGLKLFHHHISSASCARRTLHSSRHEWPCRHAYTSDRLVTLYQISSRKTSEGSLL